MGALVALVLLARRLAQGLRVYYSPGRRLGRRIARDGLLPCGQCAKRLAEFHLPLRNEDVCSECLEEVQ